MSDAEQDIAPPRASRSTPSVPPPPPVDDDGGGAPGWIVTFADMMSLLLCFFVLLLSFSVMDAEKFKAVANSLKEAFTQVADPNASSPTPKNASIKPTSVDNSSPQQLKVDINEERLHMAKEQIDDYVKKEQLDKYVQTEVVGGRLKIVNSNPLNFSPGEAKLLESSMHYLDAIVPVLKIFDFLIQVEGHTDDTPINTVEFQSNWELASARAANFVRYLEDRDINPKRLAVVGYGPYHPIAPNDTEENRAINRRIEILLSPANETTVDRTVTLDN